ncbi:MAG TPA: cysteine--tRNA ligase [Cytophagaceae bacterium]|jgi:cysteinyl-tRNA synthetase
MEQTNLRIYNTLSRKKEIFEPLNPPYVGMYLCGPTVYGDAHLGNARAAISFDILYRYLLHLGYKVRYVRNITDVGHLEQDADEGEDKIAKKAKLEKLEPMEVVQHYTSAYHKVMDKLNVKSPSIEPHASAHIPEQIEMIEEILKNGLAYIENGSVYFDVEKYSKDNNYGILSGRVIDDLRAGTRELDGQKEKRSSLDFALWKKASPEHIMRWNSPWSAGFPGWHLECSAMSSKYLGKQFDIHGGGMDLMFPHHECEIAQAKASNQTDPAKYWMHNNMITLNGQKMSKSLGNSVTMDQLFNGDHPVLQKAFSPMTVRFFILQAHYRSTLDFSNEAIIASGKGYKKILNGLKIIKSLSYSSSPGAGIDEKLNSEILGLCKDCYKAMDDDLNTAVLIATLFNLLKKINLLYSKTLDVSQMSESVFEEMKSTFILFTEDILGLVEENNVKAANLVDALLDFYKEAKDLKQYDKVDKIRTYFKQEGLVIKDLKTGIDWSYEE